MNSYVVGGRVRLRGEIRDTLTGELVDPSAVVCRVKKPDGVIVTPAVAKDAMGIYSAEVTLDVGGGLWSYRFEATGAVQSAEESLFFVRESSV